MNDGSRSIDQRELETLVGTGGVAPSGVELGRGEAVGRFVVLSKLGAGGMGIVHLCYDPELDRRVALKLLRGDLREPAAPDKTRLLREAQAMARLTHANVVTLYDVGEHAGRVYLAMEYVQGSTLTKWQTDGSRAWRDLVEIYRQAGSGLAAAHAKGLVHRDFKPDNVLVAADGRVLVTDFGLARPTTAADPVEANDTDADDSSARPQQDPLATPVTQIGSVVGTPAYMAPEQHLGQTVDARTDQFSFCVALWEALYGQRPFAGETLAAIAYATTEGNIQSPRSAASVPPELQRVLRRGLSPEPESRWPSMNALLEAIDAVPRRRRVLIRTGALLGGVGLTVALVLAFGPEGGNDPCEGAAANGTKVWNAARRDRIGAAVTELGIPHAADTWARANLAFDDYFERWGAARLEACEATRVTGTQSEAMLDKRMACLDRSLQGLDVVLQELQSPDKEVIKNLLPYALTLESPDRCQARFLLDEQAVPEPDQLTEVEALRGELSSARARARLRGKWDPIESFDELVDRAHATEFAPIVADVMLEKGRAQSDAGLESDAMETLHAAVVHAVATEDKRLMGQTELSLAEHIHVTKKNGEEALRRARLSLAYGEKADAPRLRFYSAVQLASTTKNLGRHQEAADWLTRARSEAELAELSAVEQLEAGYVEADLHRVRGTYFDAIEPVEHALEITRRDLGPDHPETSRAALGVANAYYLAGRQREALELWQECERIEHAAFGGDTAASLACTANVITAKGELGEEPDVSVLRDLVARYEAVKGPDHPGNVWAYLNLANHVEDPAEKMALLRKVVGINERTGVRGPVFAGTLVGLAEAVRASGDLEEAIALIDRAEGEFAEHPEHPSRLLVAVARGSTEALRSGRDDAATQAYEDALDLVVDLNIDAYHRADAEFMAAKFFFERGQRKRGLELARKSQADFEESKRAGRQEAVREWIAAHQ